MEQSYTSANTSINSSKLPALTKLVDWNKYSGKAVLDYGGGKYDNLKAYLKEVFNVNLYVYDKYNRSINENEIALACQPDLILCSNVLNIIDKDEVIQNIVDTLCAFGVQVIFYIYEGDGSGVGAPTKTDCYQRNEKTGCYLRFFKDKNIVLRSKTITVNA